MDYLASVQEKVIEYINDEMLFTSVDIANAVKSDGLWVRNREVRDWLHENFSNKTIFKNYITTQITVCKGSSAATLYHPDDVDADAYIETDQQPLTPDEVKAIAKTKVGKVKLTPDIDKILQPPSFDDEPEDAPVIMEAIIRSVDRIKIPGSMIRKLGWVPGQIVDPALILTSKVLSGDLVVNSDYRVSIPRSSVSWGTSPVKVILKGGKIHFKKARV